MNPLILKNNYHNAAPYLSPRTYRTIVLLHSVSTAFSQTLQHIDTIFKSITGSSSHHLRSYFSTQHKLSSVKYSFATISTARFIVTASSSPSSPSTTVAEFQGLEIKSVPTKPIEGQKTGTSGLRKKVKVFMQENYLANWIQALFNSLPPEDFKNGLLVLGGDG
uniref:Phosphoglucomutase, chloroplastic-like n=1 Tax=Nicotiana tabacum TaxID=4097 RepID=A0A1S4AD25_TOBAC|nr:PREDICTED: phosphoglucomutase, chloroplastic-like [Nicotiana tabacum]